MFSAQRKSFLRFQLFLSRLCDVMVRQKNFHMKLNLKVEWVELVSQIKVPSFSSSAFWLTANERGYRG